ncbi:MAG: acylphosphatase [Cetobacterium sp.]|uniref:acylphosphatase n=1 Tax=Cetobacterium sp. ZWU0022 TaxID=1340502 RepID=UPI0006466ACF|nr:acylphosphatase [Cetobacterium sp. ZWU0022]
MKTYHFLVKGRVQGVGYRITTQLNAQRLGVKGVVKNLSNGDVEVFAQGEDIIIQNFKKYLKIGSIMSKVTSIEESILDTEKFEEFKSKY